MSLVELRTSRHGEAVSGGAMDKVVEVRKIDRRVLIAGGAATVLLLLLLFYLFAPRAGSQTVSASRAARAISGSSSMTSARSNGRVTLRL